MHVRSSWSIGKRADKKVCVYNTDTHRAIRFVFHSIVIHFNKLWLIWKIFETEFSDDCLCASVCVCVRKEKKISLFVCLMLMFSAWWWCVFSYSSTLFDAIRSSCYYMMMRQKAFVFKSITTNNSAQHCKQNNIHRRLHWVNTSASFLFLSLALSLYLVHSLIRFVLSFSFALSQTLTQHTQHRVQCEKKHLTVQLLIYAVYKWMSYRVDRV